MHVKRFLFFWSFFFLFLGLGNSAFAQDSAGIQLVPAMIERSANPGDILDEELTITNESNSDKEFYIYKKNIKGVEAGGVPIFAESELEPTGFELTEWVNIPSEPIKVGANSSINLPIKISVPFDASPGSHFGGIFVSVEPPKLREIGAGVGYEVASVLSIRISGLIVDSARIRAFSTDKLLYGKKEVVFSTKVENQGNIMIRPRGPVTITSMFNKKPETFTMNESQAGVFPGTTRDFEYKWSGEGVGFGRYEAVVALVYDGDGGQRTIDSTLVFWVFPAKIMLIVLGVFVSIIGVGYALTKYYINQAIMRAAGGRRIAPQRYRKQVGVSRFTFVFIVMMGALVLFLLAVLIFFA